MRFRPDQYDAIIRRLVEGGIFNGETVDGNPNMLVPWYLMSSLAYYEWDSPFLTDGCYDWICQELGRLWDQIEHRHKHLISPEALSAGTGYDLAGKIPTMIVHATKALLRDYKDLSEIAPRAPLDIGIDDLLGGGPLAIEDLL